MDLHEFAELVRDMRRAQADYSQAAEESRQAARRLTQEEQRACRQAQQNALHVSIVAERRVDAAWREILSPQRSLL